MEWWPPAIVDYSITIEYSRLRGSSAFFRFRLKPILESKMAIRFYFLNVIKYGTLQKNLATPNWRLRRTVIFTTKKWTATIQNWAQVYESWISCMKDAYQNNKKTGGFPPAVNIQFCNCYKAKAKSWFYSSLSPILIMEDLIYRLFFIVSFMRLRINETIANLSN